MTRSGQWCYATCQDGYTGYNKTCYKDCPADAPSRYMATCSRHKTYPRGPASTQPCTGCTKIGLKYYEDCKSGYSAMGSKCKGMCPDGTKDAGF